MEQHRKCPEHPTVFQNRIALFCHKCGRNLLFADPLPCDCGAAVFPQDEEFCSHCGLYLCKVSFYSAGLHERSLIFMANYRTKESATKELSKEFKSACNLENDGQVFDADNVRVGTWSYVALNRETMSIEPTAKERIL